MKLRNFLVALLLAVSIPTQAARRVRKVYVPPPPPPPMLLEAAGAYFSGDYQRVIGLLGDVSLRDRPMEAQRFLFLAAAAYNLLQLEGGNDEALKRMALENVRRCRAIAPSLHPSEKAFSPRFVAYFDSAR